MKNAKKSLIVALIFVAAIFVAGCTKQQPVSNDQENESDVEITQEVVVKPEAINYKGADGLEVINNEIFYNGEKMGSISNNKILINFENKTYSFEMTGGIDKLSFRIFSGIKGVVIYDGLAINLPTSKDGKIIYECNGPLLPNRTYEYCVTNSKDTLSQYEFGGDYRQASTGAGWDESWNKIFIKKINDTNIIFEGKIGGTSINSGYSVNVCPVCVIKAYESLLSYGLIDNVNLSNNVEDAEANEKLGPLYSRIGEVIKSKQYLDKIKNEAVNISNESKWQRIVNSFSIE